jgi:hypothetical protein
MDIEMEVEGQSFFGSSLDEDCAVGIMKEGATIKGGCFDVDPCGDLFLPTPGGDGTPSTDVDSLAGSLDSDDDSDSLDSDLEVMSDVEGDDGTAVPQQRSRRDETLLIFDWDDTLLPSTFIQQQGLKLTEDSQPTPAQWEQLKELSFKAARTLRLAKREGRVVLVTNAEKGWVELSCRKFSPWLFPFLEGLKIVSARSEYEHRGIASPFEWKYLAFESEISNWSTWVPSNPVTNVISIGDAGHERMALLKAAEGMPNCQAKSVKLCERPGVPELLKEHELLDTCLREIVRHDGSLDLCLKF